MPVPLIPVALGLAEFVPKIIGWLSGSSKAEDVANTVVDVAKAVTGKQDGGEALELIKADPKLAVEFRLAVLSKEADIQRLLIQQEMNETTQGAETVREEIRAESVWTHNWRPWTMLALVSIIVNNHIIYPYLQAIFSWGVALPIPVDLWDLIKIGLGGYVVSRGVEKSIKFWRNGDGK